MMNLLKYQDKRIRAKTDIAFGRLRLSGPRFELVYNDKPGSGTPLVRTKTGPSSYGLVPKDGNFQAHWGYTKRMTSDGEEADVSQEVAYNLVVKENLATLVSGCAFNVIEKRDGDHLIELWNPSTQYGPPHSLFQEIEKVEALVADYFAPGLPVGTQLRIRAADWLYGAHPREFLWEGEPGNPPTPDGNGNPMHRFRILRSNPTPKVVALNQTQQRAMIDKMYRKLFPETAVAQ